MNSILGPQPARWRRRLVEIAAALVLATALLWLGAWRRTGDSGLARVADDQVAVVVDRLSGMKRVLNRPGYVVFLPLIQKVHLFDRSPRVLVLAGGRPDGADGVPLLIARAKDGSSFWFERIEIHHALRPDSAARSLDDTGAGDEARRKLIVAHARCILRDEVGRFTAEEIVQGECLQGASRQALSSLGGELAPYGIEVLEIALGRPRFDQAYEDAIQRRKTFDQEAEQLEAQFGRLEQEKAQKEALLRKDEEIELLKLEAALVRDLGTARKDDIRVRQDADDAFRDQRMAGLAAKLEKQGQAANLEARYARAAEALQREALELAESGELAVREALVKKLPGIEFTLVPYRRDPAPEKVEHEGAAAAAPWKPKP